MFFSNVIYLELFVAIFFLPGFFITVILGIKKFRFLLSFALSYALLVLTLLPFEYYAQPIARWATLLQWEWLIVAALAVAKTLFIRPHRLSVSIRGFLKSRLCLPRLMVPLVLVGVIYGYLAYAGPYLEIPADPWNHLFRFQWQKLGTINGGSFPSCLSFKSLFLPQSPCWYFIHTWLCNVSGLPIMVSIHVLTFVNVLIFLLAIYYFGLFLFANLRISAFRKMMMAALASLFAATTMGNMVFAYIRYYAFAPTILNYVLFLAAMAIIIAWIRSNRWFDCAHHRWFGHALWIAPVLLIVTSMIHAQETLFIFFMTLALGIVETIRILWKKIFGRYGQSVVKINDANHQIAVTTERDPPLILKWRDALCHVRMNRVIDSTHDNHWKVRERKTVILAAILLIVFFFGFAAIRYFKPGAWISANMIMPNVGIPPEPVNFIFRNLMISPPHNPLFRLAVYQLFIFYQVVGCWGLFVYSLFLLMIRHFVKIPYLIAGMVIVPLLTAFNPLTIDMMARVGQDMTLYRFHYLIPLPFVGGYLFVHFWDKTREWLHKMRLSSFPVDQTPPRLAATPPQEGTLRNSTTIISVPLPGGVREAGGGANIGQRRLAQWINFAGSILVLAGLISLVFPINAAGIYAPHSKIYTLRKIPAGNNYLLCDDLGKIIAKYENKIILTDGWTAGILWYYSPKNTYSHVKWLNASSPEKEPPEPYAWEKLRNRGLIIINRRNGGLSITARIARHWPEDVIPKVSRYYSLEAQHYLESHPEKFRKIWSQNQIAVYAVR